MAIQYVCDKCGTTNIDQSELSVLSSTGLVNNLAKFKPVELCPMCNEVVKTFLQYFNQVKKFMKQGAINDT